MKKQGGLWVYTCRGDTFLTAIDAQKRKAEPGGWHNDRVVRGHRTAEEYENYKNEKAKKGFGARSW